MEISLVLIYRNQSGPLHIFSKIYIPNVNPQAYALAFKVFKIPLTSQLLGPCLAIMSAQATTSSSLSRGIPKNSKSFDRLQINVEIYGSMPKRSVS